MGRGLAGITSGRKTLGLQPLTQINGRGQLLQLSGGSIAEEGSVVTFEDFSEFTNELNLDWKTENTGIPAAPSPN